jgi:SAM-dependent methyltransferase
MSVIEARKQEEVSFHDQLRTGLDEQRWSPEAEERVSGDPLWANFKYYAIEGDSLDFRQQWIEKYVSGATVLDYCCGNGLDTVLLAKLGARRVVGIDLSPVSIQNCRVLAEREGVAGQAEFEVMDAEVLAFDDRSFDLIVEYGVLHHLVLDRALSELARVLKPGGHIICTETLAHNPFIRAYRRLTPKLRTAWEAEHILGRPAFDLMSRHFKTIERRFFHVSTIAAVPLRNTPLFKPALAVLRRLDAGLLALPGLQWQAWQVVFKLSDPR